MWDKEKNYALLFSGGQDSTTCLLSMLTHGVPKGNIYLLNMVYGQKHLRAEELAISDLTRFFRMSLWRQFRLPIPSLSALTDATLAMGEPHVVDKTLPASFVPGRNLAFILYAAQLMYSLKGQLDTLVIGVNSVDYSGYPDCRTDSVNAMEVAVRLGFNWPEFMVMTPLSDKSKVQIVAEAACHEDFEEAMKRTHTCYNGVVPMCGDCPACKIRAKAFSDYGILDPREKYV